MMRGVDWAAVEAYVDLKRTLDKVRTLALVGNGMIPLNPRDPARERCFLGFQFPGNVRCRADVSALGTCTRYESDVSG